MSACGLPECSIGGCQYSDKPGSPCYEPDEKLIEEHIKKENENGRIG